MQYEINTLKSLITIKETEFTNTPKKKFPGPNIYQMFKEELTPIQQISSRKQKRNEFYPINFIKLVLPNTKARQNKKLRK